MQLPAHRSPAGSLSLAASICAYLMGVSVLPAAPYYVATNGPGGDAQSWGTAASNIQDAISLCVSGDVVWVSNGVYSSGGVAGWPPGTVLTNRVAITNAITVRSANNNPSKTIVEGEWDPVTTNGPAAVRCVFMANNSRLIGFTLTNGATLAVNAPAAGTNDNHHGGGVYCQSTRAQISNCVISGNSAGWYGGGALSGMFYNCVLERNTTVRYGGGAFGAVVYDATVRGNRAYGGGGAYMGSMYNCIVTGNMAGGYGGGGINQTGVTNCTIAGNWTPNSEGGGARFSVLKNCLVAGNYASGVGGGTYQGYLFNCTVVGNYAAGHGGGISQGYNVENCIVYFNHSPDGSNYYGYSGPPFTPLAFTNTCTTTALVGWVAGNITTDPMFIDRGAGYGTNHVMGDYRLRVDSPCINAGINRSWMNNSLDRDGNTRIRYGTVDIGAFERIYEGSIYNFY